MSQSLVNAYLHIIFSTKHRTPLIHPFIEEELFINIGNECNKLDCQAVKVGGHLDHVHIACKLSKKISLIKLLGDVKKHTSLWIKTNGPEFQNFYWQSGYAAFSVSPADINNLVKYIENQKEHHKKITFQEELRLFFSKYQVDYDERYVWD